LAYDTILANARFFDDNIDAVPRMALTVGVATVLDAREVVVVVTGQRKALALSKTIEGSVNHLVRSVFSSASGILLMLPTVDTFRSADAPLGPVGRRRRCDCRTSR
jgi:6-phosphogluconolactonase/glucosamine-6-phosphate isomerase/deaminase